MNTPTNQTDQKGFTIIEVVLVLAIAGLIFLMVFLALPALQRSQRDNQRKADLGRMQTAINNYQSQNKGRLPGESATGSFTDNVAPWNAMKTQYITVREDTFADPGRGAYVLRFRNNNNPPAWNETVAEIYIKRGSTCEEPSAGRRKVALRIALEGGGVACVNN